MGWQHTRYKSRPEAKNKSARIAWDCLSEDAAEMNPPRTIATLWYAPEMFSWNALLNSIEGDPERYIDMDVLEVTDRRINPHKYAEKAAAAASKQEGEVRG